MYFRLSKYDRAVLHKLPWYYITALLLYQDFILLPIFPAVSSSIHTPAFPQFLVDQKFHHFSCYLFIFYCLFFHKLFTYSAAHKSELQLIRIFVVNHTSIIFHPLTLFFYIRQNSSGKLRVHTFQIFIVPFFFFLFIEKHWHRIYHIIRQFGSHSHHFHFSFCFII